MSKTYECNGVYKKMVFNKARYPYPFGLYKFKESLSLFKSIDDEIGRIAFYGKKCHRFNFWHYTPEGQFNLQHCTPEDRFEYLAKLPLLIAERLGSAVYPAIDGLLGDGLTQLQVNKIKQESQRYIQNLVDRCDETNHKIKRNAKFIERNISSWHYEPTRLVSSAIRIVEDILYSVEMASRIDDGISVTDYLNKFEQKIKSSLHRYTLN